MTSAVFVALIEKSETEFDRGLTPMRKFPDAMRDPWLERVPVPVPSPPVATLASLMREADSVCK